jgi:hypothetical protein
MITSKDSAASRSATSMRSGSSGNVGQATGSKPSATSSVCSKARLLSKISPGPARCPARAARRRW